MTKQTIAFLLHKAQQLRLPQSHQHTPHAQKVYEEGLDMVESWRGNPYIIDKALEHFCETNSSAYACAGIAFALSTAGYISDGKFDPFGGEQGLKWLEEAQSIEPDRPEINVIEAILYFRLERFDDARLVLDEILRRNAVNYWIARLEMSFAERRGDLQGVQRWYNQAKQIAANETQSSNALKAIADAFLRNKDYDKAIKAYQMLGQRTPKDPWTWHNLSIIYMRQRKLDEAERYNARALGLMDFIAARDVQRTLRSLRQSKTGWLQGLMDKLFRNN